MTKKLFSALQYYDCRMKPLVAGSCGPYGACLHDGSEYTGSYIDHVTEQVWIHHIVSMFLQKESHPARTLEAYRPQRNKYSIICPIPGKGVSTLDGGYLPWLGGGGYLPWGTPILTWPVYLPWPEGYLPWGTPHPDLAWGVPTLVGGGGVPTYLHLDLPGIPPPGVNRLKTLPSDAVGNKSQVKKNAFVYEVLSKLLLFSEQEHILTRKPSVPGPRPYSMVH